MGNKSVKASIDRQQLCAPYAAIKEVQAQADKRTQRVVALLKEAARGSSGKSSEEKRR